MTNMKAIACPHLKKRNTKYIIGRGQQQVCTACGAVLIAFYRGKQPENIPGTKVRMSKKERRAAKQITE